MTSRETQELGKNAARESGLAKKNIVRDEGIEKKIPQHKDSKKKIPSYRKSPPPPQTKLKWSAPKVFLQAVFLARIFENRRLRRLHL